MASKSGNKLKPNSSFQPLKLQSAQSLWLGINLCLGSSYPKTEFQNRHAVTPTVVFSFPTSNPERITSTEKPLEWSRNAIKSFAMAELEARKPSVQELVQQQNFCLQMELHFSKYTKNVSSYGDRVTDLFSPMYPPLTEDAQRALDWAVDQKLKFGKVMIGKLQKLISSLGIRFEVESPGHKIFAAFGFIMTKPRS